MPKVEEAIFAKVNGKWKFKGFFDDKDLIRDVKRQVVRELGRDSFFSVVMPTDVKNDDEIVSRTEAIRTPVVDITSGSIPYMTIRCPQCHSAPDVPCKTPRGIVCPRPHAQRFRAILVREAMTNPSRLIL